MQPQSPGSRGYLVVDSITHLPPDVAGRVVVCASHGGIYAGRCAHAARVAAAMFNDAGIGRDAAGIAGLAFLDLHAIPAAAVSHRSARIGDGRDGHDRGIVSTANAAAQSVGVRAGMRASEAAGILAHAVPDLSSTSSVDAGDLREAIFEVRDYGRMRVLAIDSISLCTPQERDAVVVTGSHGGLLGGDPASAINADAFAAIFNDADVGIDNAGLGRLGPLDARGIAGITVSAWSARIGDARSTLEDGVVSHANACAAARGARVGESVRALLARFAESWPPNGHPLGRA